MTKVTLDMNTFKALASDTRLDILRALDGKKLSLKDISRATNLNKATLHEHLVKLNEAGLVKRKEREGHKWVYYKLTWKGEGLLHPENTRIVVLFTSTFLSLFLGIVMLVNYIKGYIVGKAVNNAGSDITVLFEAKERTIGDILIPQTVQFNQAPIGNVFLANQTANKLSNSFLIEANAKGIWGNTLSAGDIDWQPSVDFLKQVSYGAEEVINGGKAVADSTETFSNIPTEMIAIVHDPALQYVAIGCIIIFSILFSIGVWRLLKNKKPKL
jgi:DNA-binding transcriptional ArsR family regulator